jgi:hypothetical protein
MNVAISDQARPPNGLTDKAKDETESSRALHCRFAPQASTCAPPKMARRTPRPHRKGMSQLAFAITQEHVKGSIMASDAMMQAVGRLERAVARAESLAKQVTEEHARTIEAQLSGNAPPDAAGAAVDIDPFSRDKAIAALKSLDALIGDLQKARSEA